MYRSRNIRRIETGERISVAGDSSYPDTTLVLLHNGYNEERKEEKEEEEEEKEKTER